MITDQPSLVGIYGGTFDPIHYGHLRVAEELADEVNFQQIIFVPSGTPRLRNTPLGSRDQRAEMVRLAIQDNPHFAIDEREIYRPGVTATVESLREFQSESIPNRILCFIVGIDTFIHINHWIQWRELFNLCHLVVVARPGYGSISDHRTLPQEVAQELALRRAVSADDLSKQATGLIYIAHTSLLEISASHIRHLVGINKSIRYLLPSTISDYIVKNQLYIEKK